MTSEIVSDAVFRSFLTAMVGVLATVWLVYDVRNLAKLRGADFGDPLVRDKRFGYLMGIVIAVIGEVGMALYYGLI